MAKLLQESGGAILQENEFYILLGYFITASVASFGPSAKGTSLAHPIYASVASFNPSARASISVTSGTGSTIVFQRDPSLDIAFNCAHLLLGIAAFSPSAKGYIKNWIFHATPSAFGTSALGYHVIGLTTAETTAVFGLSATGNAYVIPASDCWVWTSRIGSLNFDDNDPATGLPDLSGEVTKRPMSWSGFVYQIKKLGGSAIVYGSNGISMMAPQGLAWGVTDLWPVGLYGKNAVADVGADSELRRHCHHAIDAKGMLLIIEENGKITPIDYSVYFAAMSPSLVMSYDPLNDLIYICDGTVGYIFTRDGLGQGPANVTGMGYKGGALYATAPGAVTFDPLNICTDIIDFGNRGEKTVTGISLGLSVTVDVFVAVDFRWDKSAGWMTSPWVKADKKGHAYPYVSGVEFRARVKLASYEAVKIDYALIDGTMPDRVAGGDKTLQKLAQLVAA